jgi:hypothetical protein
MQGEHKHIQMRPSHFVSDWWLCTVWLSFSKCTMDDGFGQLSAIWRDDFVVAAMQKENWRRFERSVARGLGKREFLS